VTRVPEGTFALTRTYKFRRYKDAAAFVQALVAIVQKAKHHPVIALSFREVEVTTYTHDGYMPLKDTNFPSPGVSERDIELAMKFDDAWRDVGPEAKAEEEGGGD